MLTPATRGASSTRDCPNAFQPERLSQQADVKEDRDCVVYIFKEAALVAKVLLLIGKAYNFAAKVRNITTCIVV